MGGSIRRKSRWLDVVVGWLAAADIAMVRRRSGVRSERKAGGGSELVGGE